MADRLKSLLIARRYSNALFELLTEKERDVLAHECHEFVQAARTTPEVTEFLRLPIADWKKKNATLLKAFPESAKNEKVKNFFTVLCERRREEVLLDLCSVFMERVHHAQGKASCIITLARPMGDKVVESIRQTISKKLKKELVVETRIDEAMLGGFKAEVDGMVLDASIRTQLHSMKNKILSSIRK